MATRLEKLAARRTDPAVTTAKLLNESWRSLYQSESVKYVIGAMQPIDPEYTKNTYAQGDRVRNQLQQRLTQTCDYEYQGSTTNDTHIRAASDIDLLLLTQKFWMLESPQEPQFPYTGDVTQDLVELRVAAVTALREAFPTVSIDATGGKSIVLTGGSLTRKVDVVPANWFHSNQYAVNQDKTLRGVQVLDANTREHVRNTPFLHNAWIEYRDSETGGGLRKAARLMKSLKYDSDAIDLSSYDLVSIAYHVPTAGLSAPRGQELALLVACVGFVDALQVDQALRASLAVPDGHRKIFGDGYVVPAGLKQLGNELHRLAADVLSENQRSFKKLAEARVEY